MTGSGAIDCDVHPAIRSIDSILPYMEEKWREYITIRGIDGLDLLSLHPRAPLMGRADWRRGNAKAATDFESLKADLLDKFNPQYAICNVMYGVQAVMSDDLSAALCAGTNNWLASEWLDRDSRLRGSINIPIQNPEVAVAEIERCAADGRFVQILMLGLGEMMLGRRIYWPIYEAAVKHGLPIGIHLGSALRFPTTGLGWPSSFAEDYVDQAGGLELQLLSLIAEGVFTRFPDLKIVLLESGVTWLPPFLWRADKSWRALRAEVPWVKEPPSQIVRRHVRFTTQPFDAPPDTASNETLLTQIGSDDMLLFASDYPHWQFEGDEALPKPLLEALTRRGSLENVLVSNALETYPRLKENAS